MFRLSLSTFVYVCVCLTLIGDYVHRTRPCPCWYGGRHGSGFPGHEEYGGLCDLGGQQQDQAQYHALSGEVG